MQHNFDHEIHLATEAHRRGNKPSCRHHLLLAIESLDHHEHRSCLRDLTSGTKVQNTDAQVWQVIKHEPEVRRVKLRLLTSENHQEWDAPEDTRVEWRVTGCCEVWAIVENKRETSSDCVTCTRQRCDEMTLGSPRPFTFQDALAIMERGGECEHFWGSLGWVKSRIVKGVHQYFNPRYEQWLDDYSNWSAVDWRPCSSPTQYTWEQAEAILLDGNQCECQFSNDKDWYKARMERGGYVAALINEIWVILAKETCRSVTWRPYNPEAQR